jgi:hypothetical protein
MRVIIGLLVGVVAQASGAVYGLPEPPTPAPTPDFWFLFSDDFLGMAVFNTDDYRTANVTLGGHYKTWRFAVDASMLTNRGLDGTAPSRTDELTYSLGYALLDGERSTDLWRSLVVTGIGGRTYGDLGGESVQNNVHDRYGYPSVTLPYDSQSGTDGFVYVHSRLTAMPSWEYQWGGPFGRWSAQMENGGLVSTGGALQCYFSARFVSTGRDSMTWMGVRYQWNGGDYAGATSTIVAEKESGWWIDVGLSRTPGILVLASLNPSRETVAGSIGITADTQLLSVADISQPVELAMKFWPGVGNLGVDVRWQPGWLRQHSLSERDQVVFVYDFGDVPGYDDWTGNTVAFDQMLLGWAPSWSYFTPHFPLTATFNTYVAGGVRLERVQENTANPRYPDTGIHVAAVGQGGVGARFGYCFVESPEAWANQFRLGIGIDGWLPYPTTTVSNGADTGTLFRSGYAWYLTLGSVVEW